MSLQLYDKSLSDKLTAIFPNVIMAPPEQAFSRSADGKAKVKLPLVSAYRMTNPVNFEEYNRYEVTVGRAMRTNPTVNNELLRQQGIPITITYQIDIWANFREHADGLYREIVFYMMTNPNLTIQLPNLPTPQDFAMKLTDVETPTEYASFDDSSNYLHRYTLTYEIDHARLFFQVDDVPLIYTIPTQFEVEPTGGENDD